MYAIRSYYEMLRGEGFKDGKQLQETDSNAKSVFLLFKKRMDMIAENPIVMTYEAKKIRENPNPSNALKP